MKRNADYAPETDLDQVAQIAFELAERVRDENPVAVHSHLVGLCAQHPVKAAQLLQCLAIWFDPNTTTAELWERVNSVARSRVTLRKEAS